MKRMLMFTVIALAAFFATAAMSSDFVQMTWQQESADLPNLKEWVIYEGSAADTPNVFARIPNSGSPSMTKEFLLTISGEPGTIVKKYFSISAVSKNGSETTKTPGKTSDGINFLEFTIPYKDVTSPQTVIFKIIYQ